MLHLASLSSHSRRLFDDLQGFAYGITSSAFGFVFLNAAGLLAGQTAGLAIILAHYSPLSFGQAYFLVNLPFYVFGLFSNGRGFVLRTFICVSLVSLLADLIPHVLTISHIHPAIAAVAFGVTAGLGLLGIIRHRASLGGSGMLAVFIQERFGINAGKILLLGDILVFGIGVFIFPPSVMAYSFLGALILNCVITWNHIPGRYSAN